MSADRAVVRLRVGGFCKNVFPNWVAISPPFFAHPHATPAVDSRCHCRQASGALSGVLVGAMSASGRHRSGASRSARHRDKKRRRPREDVDRHRTKMMEKLREESARKKSTTPFVCPLVYTNEYVVLAPAGLSTLPSHGPPQVA